MIYPTSYATCINKASSFTQVTNGYFSLTVNNCHFQGNTISGLTDSSCFITLRLYVQCNEMGTANWTQIGTLATALHPMYDTYGGLTNSAGTTLPIYINSSGQIYCRGGHKGHGFAGSISYLLHTN